MKISNKLQKFQEGGAAPAPAPQDPAAAQGAPAGDPSQGGGEGQDPVQQLVQMAQQALQAKDCNAAMAVCDGLLQVLSQAQGGGAPAPDQGQPVYKKGGVLVRRTK